MTFKKLTVCIALFLASTVITQACGFYPYGETLRYNFLKPKYMYPNSGDHYFFTTDLYSYAPDGVSSMGQYEENCLLWMEALGDKFIYEDVYQTIYETSRGELTDKTTTNPVIRLLQTDKFKAHLDYLLFAKSISFLNGQTTDPWETEEKSVRKKRNKAIKKALKYANSSTDEQLKRRYAHLAIRLGFYNWDEKVVTETYAKYFKADEYKDAIDYWALHFKLNFDPYDTERNVKMALVFLNSPEKRNAVGRSLYYSSGDLYVELATADTDAEKIAVLFYHACTEKRDALDYIRQIADIDPAHPCLDFLALREINKLEAAVLTSYYLNFSGRGWYYYDLNNEYEAQLIKETITESRFEATDLYQLMDQISDNRKTKTDWWELMKEYAFVMSWEEESHSADLLAKIKDSKYSDDQRGFLKQIYLLSVFSHDEDPELKDPYIRSLLSSKEIYQNQKLLIAIAKELQNHEHLNTAALVFSQVNQSIAPAEEGNDYYYYEDNSGYWKADNLLTTLGADYYTDYFTYVDATYTTYDVQQLINHVENAKPKDDFEKWLYGRMQKESTRLYDMLGTKYMRKQDFKSALSAFEQVNDTLWTSKHYPYKLYLSENPFSNDFYGKSDSRHRKEIAKRYTKPQIVKELMDLENTINTSAGDKKAKAAFRLANVYRNMSFYGNAWMMRRYFWTRRANRTGFEDDDEYFFCLNAQKYYKLASESTTSKDFRVVALVMQGLCVNYQMSYEIDPSYLTYEQEDAVSKLNPVYKKLRKDYGKDYPYVVGSCESYQQYFESIK